MRTRMIISVIAAIVVSMSWYVPDSSAGSVERGPSIALFEGRYIDLRVSWDDATACASDNVDTVCFRTETELDRYLGVAARLITHVGGGAIILSTCASPLKLYANNSFGGLSLSLFTRSTVTNLSLFGFDNVTSSYQVGACSSIFYDRANGAGAIYPGNTSAGASATSMVAGWDNRISSIFIS